jgi:hypothetical protein
MDNSINSVNYVTNDNIWNLIDLYFNTKNVPIPDPTDNKTKHTLKTSQNYQCSEINFL